MKIELTKNQAETIASLAVFADNPRTSYTPVLTEIAVTITEGKLTATAGESLSGLIQPNLVAAA
jgi:hypothetical protein